MSELLLGPGFKRPETLPDGWDAAQIGDEFDIGQGGKLGLTKERHYVSSGVAAYSAAGQDGFVDVAEYTGQAGVVLSAIGANCGRCFYADGNWTTLANVQAIVPKGRVTARYLFYRANLPGYWERSGSAQPFIKPSSIKKAWIAFPRELEAQVRVTRILGLLDTQIEHAEALIAKQEQVRAGLMQDLFTRGLDKSGRLRPPREEAPGLYHETALGWLPKGWRWTSIDDLKSLITSGSRDWGKYYSTEGPLFVRIGNLTRSHVNFRLEDQVRVMPPVSGEGTRTALMPSDILISITADLGIVGLVPKDFGEAYINQHIALVRLKNSRISGFVANYLSSAGQKQFRRLNDAGAKAGLNLPTIAGLTVPLPDDDRETVTIADTVFDMDRQIETLRLEQAKNLRMRSGLLQDLLTGKVRVDALLNKRAAA